MATLPASEPIHPIRSIPIPVVPKMLPKALLTLLLASLLLASCTKVKSTDIGVELLPAIDNITTFDTTLEIVSVNRLFGDSAIPLVGKDFQARAMEHVLGAISNDPLFGTTTASIFMEMRPPFYPYFFENVKDSLYLDSVVLCLKWNRTFGDTNALQKVNVFKSLNVIRTDTSYNTDVNFRYGTLLGTKDFRPRDLNDSLFPFGQRLANQFRIRLSDEFGRELLGLDSSKGKPYGSDSAFREYFRGFAIVSGGTSGGLQPNALMGFSPSDTVTQLALYYRAMKNGKVDTLYRRFRFDNIPIGGNANRVVRDHSGSEITRHLSGGGPKGDSLVYIQTAPGSYAILRIPAIQAFKASKGNVIVNLAELVMEQVPDSRFPGIDGVMSVPDRLYMDFLDTTTYVQTPFLTDAFDGGSYVPQLFGGAPSFMKDASGNTTARYRFYITRYLQNIITRNTGNFPIYLYAPYNASYTNLLIGFNANKLAQGRVRLGGGSHSTKRMRLRIVYTKL
jgi:hypothetical protein